MHLLANPAPEGEGEGGQREEEEEARPLDREVVAQVVDALFDRQACVVARFTMACSSRPRQHQQNEAEANSKEQFRLGTGACFWLNRSKGYWQVAADFRCLCLWPRCST